MSSEHVQHQFAEGYSERNPVPTVQNFREERQQQERDADAHPPVTPPESISVSSTEKPLPPSPPTDTSSHDPHQDQQPLHSPIATSASANATAQPTSPTGPSDGDSQRKRPQGDSKQEVMDKANASKSKPTDHLKKNKTQRIVHDPVTNMDVIIKDAVFSSYDNDALDPAHPKSGPASNPPQSDSKTSPLHTSPHPAHPANIFFQPFPPTISIESLRPLTSALDRLALAIIGGLALMWCFIAFGRGFWGFLFYSTLIGGAGVASCSVVSLTRRNIEKELERVRTDLHRVRGEKFSPPTPESVEWLNALLKTVWGLINPDMFISIADMVEDVMQASLPSFIDAVKLSDLGQGTNPVRVVSMRGLPDSPRDKEYPRKEWIDQGRPPVLTPEGREQKEDEGREANDQSGDYVNYEVSLSYQAKPGQGGNELRASNIHLMIEFFLGLYDWVHIPIPIYAVVEGFAVTARLRLQLVADPPFVRNLTVTLMGVPKVEVSVVPLAKVLPNLLDLPFISGFVQSAIAAAANEYVAPKSLTLNLAQLLVGDGVKKDTAAVGVLMITIHHATGLSAQDRSGTSDPYVVLAYTKLGKPLYSSRIILEDLNPVFEETAFLLVTPDEINAEEDLSLQLWDSDQRTADDLVGRVVVSLKELMKKPNTMMDRTDHLTGFEDADSMPGKMFWSVGYFDKHPLNKSLQISPTLATNGEDHSIEEKEKAQPTATLADSKEEADALTTPPDPSRPAGVLSVIVHHINNLERQDLKGSVGDREGSAGQDTDDPSEQSTNLPSAYAEILFNDDMIYKTRTKQYTTMPFYEAGTERFIRDWTKTVVRVVIRDAKLREHDPILGIVNLPLKDVLARASAVSGLHSLQEGVGFGRARISVLFKSFNVNLPRQLSGWDTGTIHILSDVKIQVDEGQISKLQGNQLSIRTTESSSKVPGKLSTSEEQGILSWTVDPAIRLPLYSRYQSALQFEVGGKGFMLNSDPVASASLWLQDIPDDEEVEIKIPLVVAEKPKQLRQNYINDQTARTHGYEHIGYLRCKLILDSGLDADHEGIMGRNQALRHNFETWEHIEGQANQAEINSHAADDGVIDKNERKAIERAHERELARRHRGAMQFAPVRTAIWMKDGLKARASMLKEKATGKKGRVPTVESEA